MNIGALRLLVTAYSITLGYLFYLDVQPWTLDDAFISFRYAENWVNGNGLVYNPGEYVEGYTSFLWVALLAFFYSCGIDTLFAAKFLCVLFALLSFLGVMFSHRYLPSLNKNESLTAALLLGTCGVFIPWSFSGMEVSLFIFLTVSYTLLAIHWEQQNNTLNKSICLGLLLSASILCRPEGILIAAFVVSHYLLQRLLQTKYFSPFKLFKEIKQLHFLCFILPVISIVCLQYVFRMVYYGEWMPNTYYVKVGWTTAQLFRGWHYVYEFLWSVSGFLIIILYAFFRHKSLLTERVFLLLMTVVILFCIYCVLIGGDSMPAFRFMAPAIPMISLLTAKSVSILFTQKKTFMMVMLLLIGFNAYQLNFNWHIHDHILSDRVALYGKEAGLWLKENMPPDAVTATNTAGSVAYYSHLHTIDMLGLTNKHIAHQSIENMGQGSAGHEKGDGAYVLSRQPDVIQFASSLGALHPMFRSELEMYAIPEFQEQYEARVIGLPRGKDLMLYFRKKL